MQLNQPYYIEPREGANHVSLDGKWNFCHADTEMQLADLTEWQYSATLPKSIYHCLHEAGVLPDPYFGTNSKQYHWVDEKIWYFKKTFPLDHDLDDTNAYLCFDGISYYSRVWLNGVLLGDHEGMFGGPVCDVAAYLNAHGENELIVEIKACNYGVKEKFNSWNNAHKNSQLVPWNMARDRVTWNGDFIVMGIWNRARLEIVNKKHLSRPYLYTVSANEQRATLFFEIEIADGQINELDSEYQKHEDNDYTFAFTAGLTGKTKNEEVEIRVKITDPDTQKTVYQSSDTEKLIDIKKSMMNERFYELQFFSKQIVIDNPKLWYPIGVGEPFLYDVEIELYCGNALCDRHTFQTGIRTFEAKRTAGRKYRRRWENFLFSVNGKEFFLKGINWAPIDALLAIDEREYKWALTLAKNAGIQMLRVWSGGGIPETDTFYRLCDEMGILVWQDHLLANTYSSTAIDIELLESQESYNLYRIRNHPSLVLHNGGNEFAAYSTGNAACMFAISRIVKDLDPARIFHSTTPDKGSAHVYRDMEPVWFRHLYRDLPFMAESGISCFPAYATLKKALSKEEAALPFSDFLCPDYAEKFPGFLNHAMGYKPKYIPHILSRASQIIDLKNCSFEQICKATQAQAYEFYTTLVQAMEENYPRSGGVLPWVFKSHYPRISIQTVDSAGQPLYPYYAIQNTYRSVGISLCLDWSIVAPNEEVPLRVKLFNRNARALDGAEVVLTVYTPDMELAKEYRRTYDGKTELAFDAFLLDQRYTDRCFVICADLVRTGRSIARTSYFLKCTSILADAQFKESYRAKPSENLYFENGPWLYDDLRNAKKAKLATKCEYAGIEDGYKIYDLLLTNTSDVPAYPVTATVLNENSRFFASDNFFLLKPGEEKQIRITCDGLSETEAADIKVEFWNAENEIKR